MALAQIGYHLLVGKFTSLQFVFIIIIYYNNCWKRLPSSLGQLYRCVIVI